MKKYILITVSAALLFGIVATEACKKKEEAAPTASFSLSSATIYEGDTVTITNGSTHAKTYAWSITGSSWTSTEANPVLYPDSAGTFPLNLTVTNGDGKTASASLNMVVLPDTIYRLSGNSKKVWWVKSIKYGGSELLTQSCQNDDEFTVFKVKSGQDTCLLTEGATKCPSGTYIFTLPASSMWRVSKGKFEFALSVAGTPFNLSFTMDKCTLREFEGTDATNGVIIKLARK